MRGRLCFTNGRVLAVACLALWLQVACSARLQASVLLFEVFDSTLDGDHPGGYQDPAILPTYPDHGYTEGFQIPPQYGDAITTDEVVIDNGGGETIVYKYDSSTHGATPNVNVSYGPFSIFTGGPSLWREGFSDLNGVLYQGSHHTGIGFNYDFLDIVLYADPGYDVLLYGFELGANAFDGLDDPTIHAVTVYDGVPNALFTPDNEIFEQFSVALDTDTSAGSSTAFTFDTDPLQAHVIFIRINASNLGDLSQGIGIDNVRFGQVVNLDDPESQVEIDPDFVDGVLQQVVPEAASLAIWLLGGGAVGMATYARSRRSRG